MYDGRLVTFPSARGHEALRHVLVAHDAALGGQEESASREVEEVVREVLLHAETRPGESLGVIAMGIRHANRVQAALDRATDEELIREVFEALPFERLGSRIRARLEAVAKAARPLQR